MQWFKMTGLESKIERIKDKASTVK
jgi:hypothetical protein